MSSCFGLLGLPDVPRPALDDVKGAWRRLAAQHHPDRGGDAAEFDRLRRAYEEALLELTTPLPCPRCKGSGRVSQTYGFMTTWVNCPDCGGSGRVE